MTNPVIVEDLKDVAAQLAKHGAAQVQFSKPLTDTLQLMSLSDEARTESVSRADYIKELRRLCGIWGEKLSVRFYGHYSQPFDAAVLHELPEVCNLVVNCIYDDVDNLDAIGALRGLTQLTVGVYGLTDKTLLSKLPLAQLSYLSLEETNTKALDLASLAQAQNLRHLALYGHKKNITAVSDLSGLECFSFNPIEAVSNAFLDGLSELQSLNFILGSGDCTASINNLPALKEVSITQVRDLTTLGDLQKFPALRRLKVQDQPRLTTLETGAQNTALAHLWLSKCPKLDSISALDSLPNLKSIWAMRTGLQIGRITPPASLTHAAVFSGLLKQEDSERAEIEAKGLIADRHPDLSFGY